MAILIVDDDSTSLQILSEIIRPISNGRQIIPFSSPQDALDWLARNPADLILTDYKMPDMDGFEFTKQIRGIAACAQVPVIVISAIEHPNMAGEAIAAGATLFLEKPVNHDECRAFCQNLLGQ